MKESDSLDALLREWKPGEPNEQLDRRVIAAYRSARRPAQDASPFWSRFWTMRVSIPAPALVAAALVVFALFLWLRPSPAPTPRTPSATTRLDITGFQPLPDGDARVIPAMEVQK